MSHTTSSILGTTVEIMVTFTKIMNSKILRLLTTRDLWPYDIPVALAAIVVVGFYSPAWVKVTVLSVCCVIFAAQIVYRLAERRGMGGR